MQHGGCGEFAAVPSAGEFARFALRRIAAKGRGGSKLPSSPDASERGTSGFSFRLLLCLSDLKQKTLGSPIDTFGDDDKKDFHPPLNGPFSKFTSDVPRELSATGFVANSPAGDPAASLPKSMAGVDGKSIGNQLGGAKNSS